jgi:hypothetical protein
VPLLHHQKALVISTTLFSEEDYKAAWVLPMKESLMIGGCAIQGLKKLSICISIRYLQPTIRPGTATFNGLTNWARILTGHLERGI